MILNRRLLFDILVDPPCLCLQQVVFEVQEDESKNHAHFGGCSFSWLRERWDHSSSCKFLGNDKGLPQLAILPSA